MNKKLTKKDVLDLAVKDASSNSEHTKLSASWAKIWLHCTKAVELSDKAPKNSEVEDFTQEGTHAHMLGEMLLKNEISLDQLPSEFYDLQFYYHKAKEIQADGNLLVEVKVNMTDMLDSHTPIYGRSDFVVLAKDGGIDIGDLKWGQGVRVDAYDNEQLKLYAIGTLQFLEDVGVFSTSDAPLDTRVTLHIIQPRLDIEYSYYNTTLGELQKFREFVKNQLKKIAAEEYVYDKGDRCQFCKGKVFCGEYQQVMTTVKDNVTTSITDLTEEQIVALYALKPDVNAFYRALDKYVKGCIEISDNNQFAGYTMVTKEGNREVVDEDALIKQFEEAGCDKSELQDVAIVGMKKIDNLAKKYGIEKTEIAGIAKKQSTVVVPVKDTRDDIFAPIVEVKA